MYAEMTDYVRDEMNRADRFAEDEGQRRVSVGTRAFVSTALQVGRAWLRVPAGRAFLTFS